MGVRILLADDHRMMREALRSLIEKQRTMEIVGEADNGRLAVQLAREASPDVIIMDVAMPEMNGIEATRRITAEHPDIKVIGLSMHSDKRFVVEMLKAGAKGFVLKECAFKELVLAIRAVQENQTFLSPRIADVAVEEFAAPGEETAFSVYSRLTDREREVLQLLAEGKTVGEIAASLDLNGNSVETHRDRIMEKLDIHTVAGLTRYALREGLTSLEL